MAYSESKIPVSSVFVAARPPEQASIRRMEHVARISDFSKKLGHFLLAPDGQMQLIRRGGGRQTWPLPAQAPFGGCR